LLCYRRPGAEEFIPFYVGETGRSLGRFGDYQSAKFSAATDFKVGKAVRRLRELGCSVVIRYRPSATRQSDERTLIQQLRAEKVPLLNDLQGYNYTTAVEDEELLIRPRKRPSTETQQRSRDRVEGVHQSEKGNIFLNMGGKYPSQAFTAFYSIR